MPEEKQHRCVNVLLSRFQRYDLPSSLLAEDGSDARVDRGRVNGPLSDARLWSNLPWDRGWSEASFHHRVAIHWIGFGDVRVQNRDPVESRPAERLPATSLVLVISR